MSMTNDQLEAREQKYLAMVGTKRGKMTILSYNPRENIYGRIYRTFRCRCDCGYEGTYKASQVYAGKVTRCMECSQHVPSKTICFECAKSTDMNLCSWAGLKPRTDWKAELITMNDNGRPTQTWRVLECPDFEEGRRPLYDIET